MGHAMQSALLIALNLLNCNFAVVAPNPAWTGDIPTSQPTM
jgi:hypothetical protein